MTDLSHPAIQRIVEVAARKGIALEIQMVPGEDGDTDLGQIVKSVVFVAPRPGDELATIVCLISGRDRVDPGSVAAVAGEVSVRPATARETSALTGYAIGAVPPFGHGRDVRIVMDQDLCSNQWVWAAAGTREARFRIAPRTLRMLANAVVAPLAHESWTHEAEQMTQRLALDAGANA